MCAIDAICLSCVSFGWRTSSFRLQKVHDLKTMWLSEVVRLQCRARHKLIILLTHKAKRGKFVSISSARVSKNSWFHYCVVPTAPFPTLHWQRCNGIHFARFVFECFSSIPLLSRRLVFHRATFPLSSVHHIHWGDNWSGAFQSRQVSV